MAVDTTTPLLGLLLQGTGNNNNTWGTNLNNSVITPIENAIAGVKTIAGLTGGAYDLTTDSANLYATIILTGTLSSDLTITVPSLAKKWTFINNLTTDGFYVLIKTSGGTAKNIPHGVTLDITCDGTNVYRSDGHRVGELFFHAGASAPAGSLECNGATPLRASAIDLFAVLSTTWGAGNGTTTFTIPDGYTSGKFVRSRTASVTTGTAQTNQNKSHTHTGSGSTGNISADHTHAYSGSTGTQSANHYHSYTLETLFNGCAGSVGSGLYAVSTWGGSTTGYESSSHYHAYSGSTGGVSSNHTHTYSFTTSTGSADGTEARPEAIVATLCIRY